MRARLLAIGIATIVAVAACGNSSSSKSSDSPTGTGGATATTVSGADLQKKVPVTAPGVTDDSIGVSVVTATTNILGGNYGQLGDGVQAYFDYVNSQGGIYGRQLKIIKRRDDAFSNNQQTVKASLAEDKPFAMFVASPLFTGAPDLAASKTPTFIWNINPEFAGKKNFFANIGAICFCGGQFQPFFAREHNLKSVGLLGYGATASSKECTDLNKKSFEKYPTAKVGFVDGNVAFAQPDLSSQVSAMKKNNVDFVSTCIDTKESLILGKEMQRQGLNVPQVLPNAYDHQFAQDNASVLNDSYVYTTFTPVEAQPQSDEMKLMLEWLQKANKTPEELRIMGWILGHEMVDGLKLAGPDFSQQKLIDGLNTQTAWSANGLVRPIDWTRQHNEPKGHPEYDYKDDCYTGVKIENGKFVMALGQGDKPWTCLSGGEQLTAPELTQTPTYKNFAP